MITLLKNEPALLLKDGRNKYLVLADLHIGYEKELIQKGIKLPSQTEKLLRKLKEIVKKNSVNSLLFLGDVKHEYLGIKEWFDLTYFFEEILKEDLEVRIVLGNHDGDLETLLPPKVKLFKRELIEKFSFGKVTFTHGHTWISEEALKSDYIIMGHHHFTFKFPNTNRREPVWVFARINKSKLSFLGKEDPLIIILPAFNQMLLGYCINCEKREEKELNPLFREGIIDKRRSKIFSLDGIYLRSFVNLAYLS